MNRTWVGCYMLPPGCQVNGVVGDSTSFYRREVGRNHERSYSLSHEAVKIILRANN